MVVVVVVVWGGDGGVPRCAPFTRNTASLTCARVGPGTASVIFKRAPQPAHPSTPSTPAHSAHPPVLLGGRPCVPAPLQTNPVEICRHLVRAALDRGSA